MLAALHRDLQAPATRDHMNRGKPGLGQRARRWSVCLMPEAVASTRASPADSPCETVRPDHGDMESNINRESSGAGMRTSRASTRGGRQGYRDDRRVSRAGVRAWHLPGGG